MPAENRYSARHNLTLLLTGTILFIAYYLADCALDSLIFGEGTFLQNLFTPTAHEVAIRSLSGFFLFTLYIVSTVLTNKNRALQRDLLNKTEEIIQRNRELDTYNHTLSNQMRNALTRIMLSKERLKFSCYQCGSNRGKKMLFQLSDDCDQFSEQVNEMLDYAAASSTRLERKRVAIDDIAREIAKNISFNGSLDFQIDNNLNSDCDPDLAHKALKILIDCAVHSAPQSQHKEIRIGMKKRANVPIYFIRSSRASEKNIATHMRNRFDGPDPSHTRINIKTAQSIIERHGGQLWSKDTKDGYPAFYFTL